MRDIDEVLRADARRWQTQVPDPPDFTATLDTAVAGGAAGRRSWRLLLSVAATIVLVVAAVALTLRLGHASSHGKQQHGPASIVVNGKTIPYAGVVPWAGPISYASDRSVVYVYADNDNIHAVADVCGVQADRARVVEETSALITIRVLGYSTPLPHGISCAGPGQAPVPVAVHLKQPLGGRTLVDASTGNPHQVLDAATVPMPHAVPDGFVVHPLYWYDADGFASRLWKTSDPPCPCSIILYYGPRRSIDRNLDAPVGKPGTASIGRLTATTWRGDRPGFRVITFQWTPRPGFILRLQIGSGAPHPFSKEQELAIARSVH